jgi:hypothetical protein
MSIKMALLKILVCSAILLFADSTIYAQGNQSISADLDGDGKPDKFWIKGDKFQYQLSTQKNITKSSKPLDIEGLNNSVSVAKNVVAVSLSAMRSGIVFKLRYDNIVGDFRVIGYDSENFGPATNDGSGKSSHNLLTGDYVANWNHFDEQKEKLVALPTIKKKSPAKKYYLAGFDDNAIEEIRSVDDKFLPAVLK